MKIEAITHTIKINLPGGIVSPGDLFTILQRAEECGVRNVHIGNRQQLLFKIDPGKLEDLADRLAVNEIDFEADTDEYPNIMSSYVTEEVLYTPNWLREGVYKDILNSFSYRPRLKINIVDYSQNLIPFFTGNMNFISSPVSNFWYLYIRFPKTTVMYCWPSLIYSEDIAGISEVIETEIFRSPELFYYKPDIDGQQLVDRVGEQNSFLMQDFDHPLIHTDFQLPYYEGFNKYRENKLWLGIYRRQEDFKVDFLKDICSLCSKMRVGQLYTTAWKSLIVKNIDLSDRVYWSNLLNTYRINVRHAANELNWQLEDLCEEALVLKTKLVREFEEADLRTYRLCFAIKTKPRTGLFGSVVIRKRSTRGRGGAVLYEILHTRDFNPNSKDYVSVDREVNRQQLGPKLIAICESYYLLRDKQMNRSVPLTEQAAPQPAAEPSSWQCRHCLTCYNEKYGDTANGLAPGVSFESLEYYNCPVCDSSKEAFEPKKTARAPT